MMATVKIPQGTLLGGKAVTDNEFEYYEFLGVPYAKPPVGELRFKSPQSPEPWVGERDATKINENNVSCQIDFITQNFKGSEDCLYLNVYTPSLPSSDDKKLPVMVFIHGGGFKGKNGIVKDEAGPDFLIESNVIIVTINYRLNVFGFLSLDIPEAAGNMGLKDQVEALKWVRDNIGYFNGDSNNVTVFGSSAGAASVEFLILSPKAAGLFHKAIIQSGSALNSWTLNTNPKKSVETLLINLGYVNSMDDSREIHDFLLKLPAEELILANTKASAGIDSKNLNFDFVPVIENDYSDGEAFLIESPQRLIREKKFNKVPLIKGFCNKEASLRNMFGTNCIKELAMNNNFMEYFPYNFDSDNYEQYNEKIYKAYLGNNTSNDVNEIVMDFLSDLDFTASIWISGKELAKAGFQLYMYEFSYAGAMNFSQIFKLDVNGAGHTDECSYLFSSNLNKLVGDFNDTDALTKNIMVKLWTDFAKTSNPTPTVSDVIPLTWPLFTEDSPVYLNIDKELKIKSDYEPERMAIFEEILKKFAN